MVDYNYWINLQFILMSQLLKDVSEKVSLELKLEQENIALGKEFISKALAYKKFDDFSKEVLKYGKFSNDFLEKIYKSINENSNKREKIEFSENVDKLENLNQFEGGLISFKKDIKKEPSKSILGLDKIAEERRKEEHKTQNFRKLRVETPSHGGGVNEETFEKLKQKKKRGEYFDTKRVEKSPKRSDWDKTPSRKEHDSTLNRRRGEDSTPNRRRGNESPKSWESPLRKEPESPKSWETPKDRKLVENTPKKEKEGILKEDGDEMDYKWYDEDEGGAIDMTLNPFEELGNEEKFKKKETEYKKGNVKRVSAKYSEILKQNEEWEQNRMMQSGIGVQKEISTEFDKEEENKTQVIVNDIKPPFLDSKVEFTKQLEAILPVKDPNSDFAQSAKKGSTLLNEIRSQRERLKSVKLKFKMIGTQFQNIVKKDQDEKKEEKTQVKQEEDAQFSKIIKDQNWGGSTKFSKLDIKKQREQLPIFQCKKQILDLVRENNIIVIVGETGSGKTTQLSQYLHEDGYTKYGKIGITQPRRVAAMSVAKRVSEEIGCELGTTVGYSIRFEDCTNQETLIKYMTDGVLLRESIHGEDLDQYSCIIMDEAHERSLHTDVLFGILKKIISKRRDLKLIVTSATMDAKKFSDFFGNVPIFTVPGRTFPVEILYSKSVVQDYVEAAVKQAINIHITTEPKGDILIFCTGQEDIDTTCYILNERIEKIKKDKDISQLNILPIYSMLPSELQAKIFEKTKDGIRKCIVATNIAETSLTLDGVIYVIDTGFAKLKVFNPRVGMDVLQVYPESQAAARQRSGRAGRTGPGKCYRLFTEQQFKNELLPNTVPEIQRTNLGNVVLLLKSLGVKNLLEFDFMDSPPTDNMKKSMYQLWLLGALNNKGDLTELGKKMIEFPLDPPLSKMVIFGDELGCSNEIITIVSCLSVPTIFYRPKDREEESDSVREKFFVPESDHLTLLNIYQQWKNNKYSSEWCTNHFIHYKAMRKVKEVRTQILDIMLKLKMKLSTCGSDWDIVRKAICAGYYHHSAKLKGIGEYVNMFSGMPANLHPSSSLFGMGFTPDYVIYHELVMTTKEYMRCVTAIDGKWLNELAPLFFSIKQGHTTRAERKKETMKQLEKVEMEIQQEKLEQEAPKISKEKMVTPGRKDPMTPKRRFNGI